MRGIRMTRVGLSLVVALGRTVCVVAVAHCDGLSRDTSAASGATPFPNIRPSFTASSDAAQPKYSVASRRLMFVQPE